MIKIAFTSPMVGTWLLIALIIKMNRKLNSGFTIPLKSAASVMDIDTDDFQCAQTNDSETKGVHLSDSPERIDSDLRDPLNLLEPDIHTVLAEIEMKLQERMKIATIKENLLFFEDKTDNPGFLEFSLNLEAKFASEETRNYFMNQFKEVKSDMRKTLYGQLMSMCSEELDKLMQAIHDLKRSTLEAFDIKNPSSGPKRTELCQQFEALLTKFKGERAKYAAKLKVRWNNRKRPEQKPKAEGESLRKKKKQ